MSPTPYNTRVWSAACEAPDGNTYSVRFLLTEEEAAHMVAIGLLPENLEEVEHTIPAPHDLHFSSSAAVH